MNAGLQTLIAIVLLSDGIVTGVLVNCKTGVHLLP